MTKLIYKSPLFRPAGLLEQVNRMSVQIELAKAVSPTGDTMGYISWLRSLDSQKFSEVHSIHQCCLDEQGECPVCVVYWQRKEKQVVQQTPSDVQLPEADVVVKGRVCPECSAPVNKHRLNDTIYCVRCDWSSENCNHSPKLEPMTIADGIEYFPRCQKCGRWV